MARTLTLETTALDIAILQQTSADGGNPIMIFTAMRAS